MRNFLPKLLLLATSFLLPIWRPALVHADYQTAKSDYTFQLSQYRSISDNYQVAKSAYLTYRTLTSQNEAIKQFRLVIQARDAVISSYYNLLQEKMNATAGVSTTDKNTFNNIKTSEKSWLADHQKKIDAAASLEDLNNAAADFENHYPQFDRETKQAIGTILLAKESSLKGETDDLISSVSATLSRIRQDGQDTTFWDRGLITTKNKLDLHVTKFNLAKTAFFPTDQNNPVNLYDGEQKLTEANQYLRETVNYVLEIIRLITG